MWWSAATETLLSFICFASSPLRHILNVSEQRWTACQQNFQCRIHYLPFTSRSMREQYLTASDWEDFSNETLSHFWGTFKSKIEEKHKRKGNALLVKQTIPYPVILYALVAATVSYYTLCCQTFLFLHKCSFPFPQIFLRTSCENHPICHHLFTAH